MAKDRKAGHGRQTYPKPTVTDRPIDNSCSWAVWGHRRVHRLHGTVGVAKRLAAVGMGNEFVPGRDAIGMVPDRGGRAACRRSVCRDIPLRNSRRQLDEIVFPARSIPLRDPARRELRRGERGALGARGRWPGHGIWQQQQQQQQQLGGRPGRLV